MFFCLKTFNYICYITLLIRVLSMKTTIPVEILDIDTAKKYLLELIENDEIYHLDSDAREIINNKGENVFPEKICDLVDNARDQLFTLNNFDPFEFILNNINKKE